VRGEAPLNTPERESRNHDYLSSSATRRLLQQRSEKTLISKEFKKEKTPTFAR